MNEWISIKDEMPKEHDSIFARFYGTSTWNKSMWRKGSNEVIVCVLFSDGNKKITTSKTHDGTWYNHDFACVDKGAKVTHWMPLPEPPTGDTE